MLIPVAKALKNGLSTGGRMNTINEILNSIPSNIPTPFINNIFKPIFDNA